MSQPRIAISCGASFLAYATHAGFLNTLHELGVRPTQVAGSSAGALATTLYASGLHGEALRREVLRLDLRWSFIKKTWWFFNFIPWLWRQYPGFFDPAAAVQHLRQILGYKQVEDLQSPRLTLAVSQLNPARAELRQSGDLAATAVASCCVPLMFKPQKLETKLYCDGGVAHEIPVDQWLDDPEVDIIIAHRVNAACTPGWSFFPGNLLNVTGAAHQITCDLLMDYRRRLAEAAGKRFFMITTIHPRPAMISSCDLSSYYQKGSDTAKTFFEEKLQALLR